MLFWRAYHLLFPPQNSAATPTLIDFFFSSTTFAIITLFLSLCIRKQHLSFIFLSIFFFFLPFALHATSSTYPHLTNKTKQLKWRNMGSHLHIYLKNKWYIKLWEQLMLFMVKENGSGFSLPFFFSFFLIKLI